MKLLVFLQIGADVRVPPQRDPRTGRVRQEWLVRELDPGSARALDLALELKGAGQDAEVTAVHLGPAAAEPWLRRALAQGCDKAVRVWDEEVGGAGVAGKAAIAAAAARVAGFDLILVGSSGVLHSSGQFGVLLAARLGVAAVTQVIDGEVRGDTQTVELIRALDGGFRERVEAKLPLVATVAGGPQGAQTEAAPVITAVALLAAQAAAIPVWSLADLGVPLEQVRSADGNLKAGAVRPLRPRRRPLAAPDAALPAFERILKLIQGSVQRREGRVVRKPPAEVVDEVFATLRDEGWLDHLRAGRRAAGPAGGKAEPGHSR